MLLLDEDGEPRGAMRGCRSDVHWVLMDISSGEAHNAEVVADAARRLVDRHT
jgi:hypothetical protein